MFLVYSGIFYSTGFIVPGYSGLLFRFILAIISVSSSGFIRISGNCQCTAHCCRGVKQTIISEELIFPMDYFSRKYTVPVYCFCGSTAPLSERSGRRSRRLCIGTPVKRNDVQKNPKSELVTKSQFFPLKHCSRMNTVHTQYCSQMDTFHIYHSQLDT